MYYLSKALIFIACLAAIIIAELFIPNENAIRSIWVLFCLQTLFIQKLKGLK